MSARGNTSGNSGSRGGGRPRGGRPRPPKPVRDESRNAAYDLMRAVDERDAYANLLMPRLLRERGLKGRDAALATELAYGTLRGLGTYDAIIDVCSDRKPDPDVADALRLGAHQLLRMRIPPHAAVGTTVDLVRLRIGVGASKFVNAVLRKIAARSMDEWIPIVAPDPAKDLTGYLAVAYSHPRWIVTALRDALGPAGAPSTPAGGMPSTSAVSSGAPSTSTPSGALRESGPDVGGSLPVIADDALLGHDVGEIVDLLEADNARPLVTLVARPGRSSVEELEDAGAEAARYSPYGAYLPEGDPGQILAVAETRAAVQDEGSQLVALALTRVPLDGDEERWLDMCAGPGGKAGLLDAIATHGDLEGLERQGSYEAFPGGAHLLAADVQYHRARLVWQTTRQAAVITADGVEPAWREGVFDRVMLDAPCTGLGALRRRPEARWRRESASVAELGSLQRRLLATALDAARPGGVVAYVTCSPHLAETRVVVEDVTGRREDVEVLDARAFLPEVGGLGEGPYVQFWPHRHGTDAMFLALLRRRT